MNIGRRIKEIYDVDFSRLIDELKMMSRQERIVLYETHSKRLFPKSKKIITLEEQLNDNHKVDRELFLLWNISSLIFRK